MSDKIKTIREALINVQTVVASTIRKMDQGFVPDPEGETFHALKDAIGMINPFALEQLAPTAEGVDIPEAIKAFEYIKDYGDTDRDRDIAMRMMVKWANHGIASLTPQPK